MSSISASDRARQTEELRQTREEYQNQETETAKRNSAERKRMQERHEAEIKRLRSEYEQQMATIRNKNKEALTDRDHEHQVQIDKVKNMYLEQIRRKTEDHALERKQQKEALENDIENIKKVSAQQKEILTDGFRESIGERDVEFENYRTDVQKATMETMKKRAEKQQAKHEKELDVVRADREDKVASVEDKKRAVQIQLNKEIKRLKQEHARELERFDENMRTQLANKESLHESVMEAKSEILNAERDVIRSKYDEVLQKKIDQMERVHQGLKTQVDGRIDGQVRSLQHELVEAKVGRSVDASKERRLRELDKKRMLEALDEENKRNTENRFEFEEIVKNRARGQVSDVVLKSRRIVQEANRTNKMSQSIAAANAKGHAAEIKTEMQNKLEHEADRSEKRLRRVMDATNETMQVAQKYHDETVDQMKTTYVDGLVSQRTAQAEQLAATRNRAEEKVRENVKKFEKKLDETVSNYEGKIAKLQEEHQAEKEQLLKSFDKRIAQREKASKVENETQAIKYEAKLAQSEEVRQKEMERLERRHQEQMADLSKRLKYFNKKA